jgi:hypothetical protein
VNDLAICLAVDEHYQQQDQLSSHPDDLISLLSIALDEVVIAHHMMRIVEDLRRCLERDSMDPPIPLGFGRVPRESHLHITLLYIRAKVSKSDRGRIGFRWRRVVPTGVGGDPSGRTTINAGDWSDSS